MTVTKDLNLGTVVTVCIFLVVQTGAAIWWAAQTTAQLNTFVVTAADIQTDATARAIYVDNGQLRQWERISALETTLSRVDTLNTVVQQQLSVLETEVKTNNDLLRELLVEVGALGRGG
jgi:hypothetical protein